MKALSDFLLKLAEIVFVRRSRGALLLRVGAGLLFASFAIEGALNFSGQTLSGQWSLAVSTAGGALEIANWFVRALGAALIALGVWFVIKEYKAETRRKVLVIEARGLRNWHGSPLMDAIPKSIPGSRHEQVLPLTQGLDADVNLQPEKALRFVAAVPATLQNQVGQSDRRDVAIFVGGLAPIPFLFTLGAMLDDEAPVTLMDWDRYARSWRQLDDQDDGVRLTVVGLEQVPEGAERVAVSVSVSYANDEAAILASEPGVPRVSLTLPALSTSSHFSEAKQRAWEEQFLDVLIALQAKDVKVASLFLAIPASLAIRFGMKYDKRNHPIVEVNQFERGTFPWAVRVPTSHEPEATIAWKQPNQVAA